MLALAGVPSEVTQRRVALPPEVPLPTPRPADFAYRVFTDGFDQTVSIDEVAVTLGKLSAAEIDRMRARLDAFFRHSDRHRHNAIGNRRHRARGSFGIDAGHRRHRGRLHS
jgi:cobalamin biosynthesis protein CobT